MSSLIQGGEKLPFLQAAVRMVAVTWLGLIQPFQCSGLMTIFEVLQRTHTEMSSWTYKPLSCCQPSPVLVQDW